MTRKLAKALAFVFSQDRAPQNRNLPGILQSRLKARDQLIPLAKKVFKLLCSVAQRIILPSPGSQFRLKLFHHPPVFANFGSRLCQLSTLRLQFLLGGRIVEFAYLRQDGLVIAIER